MERRNNIGILIIGIDENETIFSTANVPILQIPGGGHHFTVVIIGEILVDILIEIVCRPPFQQPNFIIKAIRLEMRDRIFQCYPATNQRNILFYKFLNAQLQLLRGKIGCTKDINENTVADLAGHFRNSTGPQLP